MPRSRTMSDKHAYLGMRFRNIICLLSATGQPSVPVVCVHNMARLVVRLRDPSAELLGVGNGCRQEDETHFMR